jgi:hypothetical protein
VNEPIDLPEHESVAVAGRTWNLDGLSPAELTRVSDEVNEWYADIVREFLEAVRIVQGRGAVLGGDPARRRVLGPGCFERVDGRWVAWEDLTTAQQVRAQARVDRRRERERRRRAAAYGGRPDGQPD